MSQTGQQLITIHIFKESMIWEIKASPRPFMKNQNWAYLWINSRNVIKFDFIVYSSQGLPKYIKTNVLTTCICLIYKAFSKEKKRSGTCLPTLFFAWFSRKIFLTLYFINWPNFIGWFPLLLEIFNMCILIIYCSLFDVMNFEMHLTFAIKPFFYITKKSGQKCKYLKNQKNFQHFTSFLKDFQLP